MAERMNNFNGKEWLQHSFTIWREIKKTQEENKLKHPAMFPSALAEKLINIYTKDNGEVILDPFLGVGSTLIAAKKLAKRGIGIDLNPEYLKIAKNRIEECKCEINNSNPEDYASNILLGDSRKVLKKIEDNSIDLCLNSPPYWDILNMRRTVDSEKDIKGYSQSDKDLGNISDYDKFLSELKEVYKEVYRVMKPNKRCCCVVMDIRKKDKFYPLHMDLSRIMTEIGFELEEFVIWDRQHEYNNMKTLGYPWVFRFNKVHEFICIYWKRDTKKKR
jgi:DNA modification methylase